MKGPHFFGFRSARISSKLDVAVFLPATDCDKAPPVSCLCSLDDSNEVLTFFDDRCPSCDAGASVCWNGIMSCGVSEVSGRSEAWTLNASGRKTLSLRKGFKRSHDVLTASEKWVTVFL